MKLKRMVIEFEVLYDADHEDLGAKMNNGEMSLEDLANETIEGAASGDLTVKVNEDVTKERMAKLLVAQGSAPGFLLDAD